MRRKSELLCVLFSLQLHSVFLRSCLGLLLPVGQCLLDLSCCTLSLTVVPPIGKRLAGVVSHSHMS